MWKCENNDVKMHNGLNLFSNHRQFQNWTLQLQITEVGLPDPQLQLLSPSRSFRPEPAEKKETIHNLQSSIHYSQSKMVHMFNHWLSKYHTVPSFNWENLPNQVRKK